MPRARDDRTIDLFPVPQPPAALPSSMDYGREVAHLVGSVLKEAEGDRLTIAATMTRLSGRDVSRYMLDAWSAEGREAYNLPFYLAPVLEVACHSYDLSNWLAAKRGGQLLIGKETLNAQLGKLERLREEASRKIRELKRLMGEME